jgi:hypothetical protein
MSVPTVPRCCSAGALYGGGAGNCLYSRRSETAVSRTERFARPLRQQHTGNRIGRIAALLLQRYPPTPGIRQQLHPRARPRQAGSIRRPHRPPFRCATASGRYSLARDFTRSMTPLPDAVAIRAAHDTLTRGQSIAASYLHRPAPASRTSSVSYTRRSIEAAPASQPLAERNFRAVNGDLGGALPHSDQRVPGWAARPSRTPGRGPTSSRL